MEPFVSVVVCTHDRGPLLGAALARLRDQRAEPGLFEVVVVDNASTDATADVVAAAALHGLRLVREPVLGLSHARNRGVAEARGQVVAFLDDDALADPDWVAALAAAFRADEHLLGVGGRITLRWLAPRPRWLPESLEGYYTKLDLGDEPCVLAFPRYPYGANMAVRRRVLAEVGAFRTDLGRRGTVLRSGEEEELFARIAALPGAVRYEPGAAVEHCVTPDRARLAWLLRRVYHQGRTEALLRAGGRAARLGDAARGLWEAGAKGKVRLPLRVRRAGLPAAVGELARMTRWSGYTRESLGRALAREAA